MLRIKSMIPEKGLRHSGLFSIFLDEDEKKTKLSGTLNQPRAEATDFKFEVTAELANPVKLNPLKSANATATL